MSEAMLRVQLSEIKTFRIVCKKCKRGVIEVPLNRLNSALDNGQCRLCNHPFLRAGESDHFNDLKIAIEGLNGINDNISIEIEIPSPSK